MKLKYQNKKNYQEVFESIFDYNIIYNDNKAESENLLINSENLIALKSLITDFNLSEKIDLIYIDPPFGTNNNFTITNGRASTISNSKKGDIAYSDKLLGSDFLEFIRERLLLINDLLSERGSIYLHTDYKIGHYIKIIMDEVFGINNFRNDITRIKTNPKNFKRLGYGNIKDMILFYTKTKNAIWNEPYTDYNNKDLKKLFPKIDSNGRRYTTVPLHAPGETTNGNSSKKFKGIEPPIGRHWRTNIETMEQWDKSGLIEWSSNGNPRKKIYFDEREGKRVQDIWEFKDPQYPIYPTEKNADMIDLIIKTSSNKNSIVLDCFSGSGTTLKSAHLNGRRWIGIDKSKTAIDITIQKLNSIDENLFIQKPTYKLFKIESDLVKKVENFNSY